MSLESSDDIESSGLSGHSEAPSEKSEKQREASKRAQSQLQKTQKDEKKARSDNDALFLILTHFIKNPFYEDLVSTVSLLLEKGYSSRYILSIVALVYPDAAYYIFQSLGTPEKAHHITTLHRYEEKRNFHEEDLHRSLRDWMSLWINTIQKYLIHGEVSVIILQKLSHQLVADEANIAHTGVGEFVRFFFLARNVEMSIEQSKNYARFINQTLNTQLQKYLANADIDLKNTEQLNENDLFGMGV